MWSRPPHIYTPTIDERTAEGGRHKLRLWCTTAECLLPACCRYPWGPIKAGTCCPGYRFSILTLHRTPLLLLPRSFLRSFLIKEPASHSPSLRTAGHECCWGRTCWRLHSLRRGLLGTYSVSGGWTNDRSGRTNRQLVTNEPVEFEK